MSEITRRRLLTFLVAFLLVLWPFLGVPFSILGDAINACIILVVAASLVLLTGWVGQISLAQATFVGIGAFSTGLLSRGLHIPFPVSLVLAAAISAGAATLLGIVALRVRGLYLAVATLIFAWMADEYLFRAAWLVGVGGSSSVEVSNVGRPDGIPYFDFSDRRTLYIVALAVAAGSLYCLANLRDSKTGRAFFAVRGSEVAAASLGIDVTRYKLLAFALAGFFAGGAGNLLMISQRSAVPAQFAFSASLFYLAVAVVGGITSLSGAIAAAILFAGLSEVFFRVEALAGWLEIVSAGLLAVVLLGYPGGLAAGMSGLLTRTARQRAYVGALFARLVRTITPLRQRILDRVPQRWRRTAVIDVAPLVAESEFKFELGDKVEAPDLGDRQSRRPILEVEGLTVQFGGLRAVDNVSLEVREGEIVGLIGPNGAGKTTTFNSISGMNVPTGGSVRLFGEDVTSMPVHERAQLGVARTFQVIQLFPQLTVFDNLLVATHLKNPSSLVDHVFVTARGLLSEADARARIRSVIQFLGLEEIADRQVAGLPFGILRMVEVARALVTGAPLVMLDEPASGLDNKETDRLAELLFFIRARLGVSILLIEHDVRMVTSVSDYMYVINRGCPLAEGVPADIVRNEDVVAAYLGRAEDEAEVV